MVAPGSVACASPEPCKVSRTVREEPPPDPAADPFGPGPWYANADRTLWAWAGSDSGTWISGKRGNKVLWIKPRGSRLDVSGHRLDGAATPLRAEFAGVYPGTFQPSGLFFPAAGCWEIEATAGGSRLEFVTLVGGPPRKRSEK